MTKNQPILLMNRDSFIYAVYEAFEARRRKNDEFNSHLRFEPFLEKTWVSPSSYTTPELEEALNNLINHHFNAIAYYKRHEQVSLENIAWFTLSVATFYADLEFLLKEFQIGDIKKAYTSEVFTRVFDLLKKKFQHYAELFRMYGDWKYLEREVQTEAVDWNVRPPCGALYRTQFKELFEEMRNARFGKKPFQKGKPHHDDKPHYDAKSQDGTALPDKPTAHKKPHHHESQAEGDRLQHHKRPFKNTSDRPRFKPHQSSEPSPEKDAATQQMQEKKLKEALVECQKAIDTLKKNTNIPEMPLSAQNSFIRREQHTLITEAGFETQSRGEGPHRHVCIVRRSN